jgi:glutathione S-transferase
MRPICFPQGAQGKARDQVARLFRVGDNQVPRAKAILTDAPNLADQVLSCTLSIAAAYEEFQSRKR